MTKEAPGGSFENKDTKGGMKRLKRILQVLAVAGIAALPAKESSGMVDTSLSFERTTITGEQTPVSNEELELRSKHVERILGILNGMYHITVEKRPIEVRDELGQLQAGSDSAKARLMSLGSERLEAMAEELEENLISNNNKLQVTPLGAGIPRDTEY